VLQLNLKETRELVVMPLKEDARMTAVRIGVLDSGSVAHIPVGKIVDG